MRRKESFDRLLNAGNARDSVVSCVGRNKAAGERSEEGREVSKKEVCKALERVKTGDGPGTDGIYGLMLKHMETCW